MARKNFVDLSLYTSESIEDIQKIGIYKIWFTNDDKNRLYVGSALRYNISSRYIKKGFEDRWSSHFLALAKGVNPCRKLQNACKKFGLENIRFGIVEILEKTKSREECLKIETSYITQFNSVKKGWNIRHFADSRKGLKTSLATKKKISKANMGIKNGMFGKINEKHHNAKPVYQYSLKGDFIKKWSCAREAAKELNIGWSKINACARNNRQQAYSFLWFYAYQGDKIEIDEKEYLYLTGKSNKRNFRSLTAFFKNGDVYKKYSSVAEANWEFKGTLKQTAIANALCKGITAYGYYWKYD